MFKKIPINSYASREATWSISLHGVSNKRWITTSISFSKLNSKGTLTSATAEDMVQKSSSQQRLSSSSSPSLLEVKRMQIFLNSYLYAWCKSILIRLKWNIKDEHALRLLIYHAMAWPCCHEMFFPMPLRHIIWFMACMRTNREQWTKILNKWPYHACLVMKCLVFTT